MAANSHKSKLVEDQINKLLSAQSDDGEKQPKYSPMVKKLLDGESKEKNVHKLKQLFEEKCAIPAVKEISYDDERIKKKSISPQSRVLSKARKSFDCIRRMTTSPTKPSVNRLERLVRELVQKERDYIESLERGIERYLRPIALSKCDEFEVPQDIRNQKFKLFGNIEEICVLHKSTVLPYLLSCGDNIYQIADKFINLIQSDSFYCYINYAINHKQAEELLSSYADFFGRIQRASHDRLGVMSFIIQPIQKIPRYPLLFEEMIKELAKDMHTNKKTLANLCVAKKNVERFLTRLNQALTINDIIETHEVPANLQCGLITCLQIEFGVNINEPTMLLVPSFSSHHGYRSAINIYKLGKFITTEYFDIHEHYTSRDIQSKVFLFERCLLYTKILSHKINGTMALSYRDHFMFGPNISISLKSTQSSLTIGDTVSNRYISLTSVDFDSILEIHGLIKSFYDPRHSSDSAYADEILSEPQQEDDEIVRNESMADDDWIATDIDMIKGSDEEIDDDIDFWIPRQFFTSFGIYKNKKKVEESKSRFYVTSPTEYN